MKTNLYINEGEIGNIIFELDEACAALRLTEDERRFAHDAVVAAWAVELSAREQK